MLALTFICFLALFVINMFVKHDGRCKLQVSTKITIERAGVWDQMLFSSFAECFITQNVNEG